MRTFDFGRRALGDGVAGVLAALAGAMIATINDAARFYAVADDAALAVRTHWRKSVDRAFEAVENVALVFKDYSERFVVIIAADFTLHHVLPCGRARRQFRRCWFGLALF